MVCSNLKKAVTLQEPQGELPFDNSEMKDSTISYVFLHKKNTSTNSHKFVRCTDEVVAIFAAKILHSMASATC